MSSGREEFVELHYLPASFVSQVDQQASSLAAMVTANPQLKAKISIDIEAFWDALNKEVVLMQHWDMDAKQEGRRKEIGRMRNGRFVPPGEAERSDQPPAPEKSERETPTEDWSLFMLGDPTAELVPR